MKWARVRVADKMAFREDLQSDPTLTDLQKRMISTIATHWNNEKMQAECSLSFIAAGAGTTKKMVNKYAASLADSGRVSIKRKPDYTTSTLWDVNWWFRGSAWVRHNNGGQPITDCRKESPAAAQDQSPIDAHGESPNVAQGGVPQYCVGESPKRGTNSYLTVDIGAPMERAPIGDAQGAPRKEKKENPHRPDPGFAKWKIVHAEYTGEEEDTFVAHLRSGKSAKFVLRCHVDSDDYESIDTALGIDGDAEGLVGERVQMSTNRSGPKEFRRAGPLPWVNATILSGEEREDGTTTIRVAFSGGHESNIPLSADDAGRLVAACGGEAEAIGARVRYRIHPDDTWEFRRMDLPAPDAAKEAA